VVVVNQYARIHEHTSTALSNDAGPYLLSLTEDEIRQSLRRLLPAEIQQLFRHNFFPFVWSPRGTLYAVAGRAAQDEAQRRGLPVAATADVDVVREVMMEVFRRRLRWYAILNLARRYPRWSAKRCTAQAPVLIALIALVLSSFAFLSFGVASAMVAAIWSVFFMSVILLRLMSLVSSPEHPRSRHRDLLADELPSYSVLVPLYKETKVLGKLLNALIAIDYPVSKLQILLVIEEIDVAMRHALAACQLPPHFEIVVVPDSEPRTKPKALNYALTLARGELLTVYDAEDAPHRLQLRHAAAAFAAAPPETACLQAQLAISAEKQGWLAKQFAIEYAALFGLILPMLAELELPIPLGGTSNHIKTSVLRRLGAWDAFNVTEDADLGLRFARAGYMTGVLDSITTEDATIGLGNWLGQRSRWLKGWMLTWLVHMRHPVRLQAEIGWHGFLAIQSLLLGMIVSSLFHPFFFILAVYQLCINQTFSISPDWAQAFIMASCLVVFAMGYVVTLETGRRGLRRLKIKGWYFSLLTMPVYWLLISLAAWRAAWELLWKPYVWNKTEHGVAKRRRRKKAKPQEALKQSPFL
jgi:cellulose synthase/poly-beta-1,6-N-acetylglucosamine synthase-like glycosyltransferase